MTVQKVSGRNLKGVLMVFERCMEGMTQYDRGEGGGPEWAKIV